MWNTPTHTCWIRVGCSLCSLCLSENQGGVGGLGEYEFSSGSNFNAGWRIQNHFCNLRKKEAKALCIFCNSEWD